MLKAIFAVVLIFALGSFIQALPSIHQHELELRRSGVLLGYCTFTGSLCDWTPSPKTSWDLTDDTMGGVKATQDEAFLISSNLPEEINGYCLNFFETSNEASFVTVNFMSTDLQSDVDSAKVFDLTKPDGSQGGHRRASFKCKGGCKVRFHAQKSFILRSVRIELGQC